MGRGRTQPVRAALGTRRDPLTGRWAVPTETTIRRTLARLDAEALAGAIGGWLADRERPSQRRRAVTVDGKTLCGACRDGRPAHLLAAMDHTTRAVLAQRQVDGAPGEVPAFQRLLDGLDLAGVVVTADALHTHAEAAEFLVACKQAHYLFTVKANQPTLLARPSPPRASSIAGESSRRRDPAARDQLTAQELQIAQLAAQGLFNREIGQRLFLSHRTIGTHLYRVYPKLGITGRGELARRSRRIQHRGNASVCASRRSPCRGP